MFPGAEFRVAYEEATKYGGKVILGDRPIQVRCFGWLLDYIIFLVYLVF